MTSPSRRATFAISKRRASACSIPSHDIWNAATPQARTPGPRENHIVAHVRIALIRGINVGRAKRVAMAELRALVEDLSYGDVRTLLNSGNVVFSTTRSASADPGLR